MTGLQRSVVGIILKLYLSKMLTSFTSGTILVSLEPGNAKLMVELLHSVFLLFVFTATIAMKGWFRAVAASFSIEATAQSVAGISLLANAIYTSN
jgi:hypothetical protein